MTNTSKTSSNLLGELIKKIRITNNLTQGSFGNSFEPSVTQSTVARWEKGEQNPDRIHFPKIASLLNMSVEEFIEFIENPSSRIEDLDIENKTLTYNKRHLSILKKGVTTWNKWREQNPGVIPQLSGIHLSAGKFSNLDGYNLKKANLAGLKGDYIQMNQTNLIEANLEKAQLEGGSFVGANFLQANLKKIEIKDTRFDRAIFKESNLSEAYIYKSHFKEVAFEKANMEKIVIHNVDLSGSNLKQANLESAQLTNVQLREANLIQASFKKAILQECSVYASTFIETNLEGINIENIYVSPQGFEGLPVSNLALAQYRYLQRYHPFVTKEFVDLYYIEKEVVEYSRILVNKYGEYKHEENISFFATSGIDDIDPPFINIVAYNGYLSANLTPNYQSNKFRKPDRSNSRKVLEIKNERVESNLLPEDLNIFRKTFEYIKQDQKDKFETAMSIAKKILSSTKNDIFVGRDCSIEKINKEIIICQMDCDSQDKIMEIARGKIVEDRIEMVRSSLYDKDIVNLQNILLEILI